MRGCYSLSRGEWASDRANFLSISRYCCSSHRSGSAQHWSPTGPSAGGGSEGRHSESGSGSECGLFGSNSSGDNIEKLETIKCQVSADCLVIIVRFQII